MLLYHGSAAGGLTRLTGQPCVYLTPYPCYALCYIRDPNVNYVTCGVDKDGVVRYDENFPEQLRTLYAGRSGWLYRCGEGDGAPIQTSQTPVDVQAAQYIPDVYAALLRFEEAGELAVNRWEARSEADRRAVWEMTVRSVCKNGYLDTATEKAAFYRRHFPSACAFAAGLLPAERTAFVCAWEKAHLRS